MLLLISPIMEDVSHVVRFCPFHRLWDEEVVLRCVDPCGKIFYAVYNDWYLLKNQLARKAWILLFESDQVVANTAADVNQDSIRGRCKTEFIFDGKEVEPSLAAHCTGHCHYDIECLL